MRFDCCTLEIQKREFRILVTLEISLIEFVAGLWNTVQISSCHISPILV